MAERTPLVAANWKMHKTVAETEAFLDAFLPRVAELGDTELVVCPSYPSLAVAVASCAGSGVRVAAQNMHQESRGAFTGEVSAPMLSELGVDGVILGHSERRRLFAESDQALARKVPAALEAGLAPILCVGETEAERDANQTEAVLRRQLEADLAKAPDGRLAEVVIAYEPVWAIGTGRNATPQQAEEAIGFIRSLVADRGDAAGDAVRILYGGSVNPDNAPQILGPEGVDGALVGGASLDPGDFFRIAAALSTAASSAAASSATPPGGGGLGRKRGGPGQLS
jgi:triosephosphate isomerase (TIM)